MHIRFINTSYGIQNTIKKTLTNNSNVGRLHSYLVSNKLLYHAHGGIVSIHDAECNNYDNTPIVCADLKSIFFYKSLHFQNNDNIVKLPCEEFDHDRMRD